MNVRNTTHRRRRLLNIIRRCAIVLLGLLLAELWTREVPDASNDPPVRIRLSSTSFQMNEQSSVEATVVFPGNVFSTSYDEARTKFRTAVRNIPTAQLHTFPVIIPDTTSNDNNENDYTMDVAVLPGTNRDDTAQHTVVHTSGYHGVEGYAGSAIQIAYLQQLHQQELLTNATTTMPTTTTVILVHAVNPYGMATFRRTNENNVDLNRNGLHDDEWYKVSLEHRHPNIANYSDFDSVLFNPKRPPSWTYDYYSGWVFIKASYAIYKFGLQTLKRAMVSGQYHLPEGIFYGGRTLQPSLRILHDFLHDYIIATSTSNGNGSTKQRKQQLQSEQQQRRGMFTMINVHTGLGPSGQDSILNMHKSQLQQQDDVDDDDDDDSSSCSFAISPRALQETFPNSSIPSLSESASHVADGYELVLGTAEQFFSRLCTTLDSTKNDRGRQRRKNSIVGRNNKKKDKQEEQQQRNDGCWIITQEFGTIPSPLVGIALILENMARQYLLPDEHKEEAAMEWTELTRRAFYPQTPKWRRAVLVKGLTVLQQAIERK